MVGVDGARGRWAVCVWDGPGRTPEVLCCERPRDVLDLARERSAEVVGLDVPLGLADEGVRSPDAHARAWLAEQAATSPPADRRGAASRVFMTPVRDLVRHGGTYAEVRALARARGLPVPSAQAFALLAHVRDWDDEAARRVDDAEQRLVEVHPELSFARMAGRVLAPKRSARGAAQRLATLAGPGGLGCGAAGLADALARADVPVGADDALDAAAAAWSAHRVADPGPHGTALVLPEDAVADARGVLMAIHV